MPADASVVAAVRGIAIASWRNGKRIRIGPLVRVGGRDRRNLLNSTSDRFIPDFQVSSALGMEPPLATRILAIGTPLRSGTKPHSRGGCGTVRRVMVGAWQSNGTRHDLRSCPGERGG